MGRRGLNGRAWETALVLAFPAIGLVATVVGAFAGARLGGHLAARLAPDGAGDFLARPVNKAWMIAGAFLGFFVGGGIGMGIAIAAGPNARPVWLMGIAFFSPPILGFILGGLAGLSFARRRASRPPGR
jgi:hypothetical protein